jgi:lipoate-protein ligase A
VPASGPFDVEQFRPLRERQAVVRQADRPTFVLGSTQSAEVVAPQRVNAIGGEVVRRRGGGGAVLLLPGDHLWVDAWIPREDPLWVADVSLAATWVGAWWSAALGALGVDRCEVHEGRAIPGTHGALVCFSGRGPGEVFQRGRKVVGLSQWRSREGSLFHTCAYHRWAPGPMIDLLDLDSATRLALARDLVDAALGIDDLEPAGPDMAALSERLLTSFPTWGRDSSSTS